MTKRRSHPSFNRNGPKLDLSSLGKDRVQLDHMAEIIPALMLQKFGKAIALVNGKDVASLSFSERKFVEMIIAMRNEYLIAGILCGEYQDSLWSARLRRVVKRQAKNIATNSFANIRAHNRERRRAWFRQMREILPCVSIGASV